ncbi:MAG: hypothetical protein ACK423_12295 [Burkholderiales bacterium]
MTKLISNLVDKFRTTVWLSTARLISRKLFIASKRFAGRLQTVFSHAQVLDITVENRLVHTNWPGLSTTAID